MLNALAFSTSHRTLQSKYADLKQATVSERVPRTSHNAHPLRPPKCPRLRPSEVNELVRTTSLPDISDPFPRPIALRFLENFIFFPSHSRRRKATVQTISCLWWLGYYSGFQIKINDRIHIYKQEIFAKIKFIKQNFVPIRVIYPAHSRLLEVTAHIIQLSVLKNMQFTVGGKFSKKKCALSWCSGNRGG